MEQRPTNKNVFPKLPNDLNTYRAFFRALPDAVLISPMQQKGFATFLEVNPKACEFYGYAHDEFLELSLLDLIEPTEKQEALLRNAQKQLQKNDATEVTFKAIHKTKNGGKLQVKVHCRVLRIGSEKVLFTVCKDIGECEQTQAVLSRAKETAERYLNISAEITVGLDVRGNITLINENGSKLLGYPKNALIGKNWFDTCLPVDIREQVRLFFNKLMQGKVAIAETHQNEIITRDGHRKTILWHNSTLKDQKGAIVGTLSSGKDITAFLQVQQALKESEARYRLVFEHSPIALWEEDLTEMIRYLNDLLNTRIPDRNLRAFLEQHPEEIDKLLGKIHILQVNQACVELHRAGSKRQVIENLAHFLTPDFPQVFIGELESIASGSNHFSCEERIRTLDGQIKTIFLKFALLRPQKGSSSRYIGLIATTDITDLKNAIIKLRETQKQLEILHELDKALLEARSVENILNAALNKLMDIVPADRLSVLLFAEDGKNAFVIARGLLQETIGQGKIVPLNDVLSDISKLRTGKIHRINTRIKLPKLKKVTKTLIDMGFCDIYNIPIMAHGELLGTLNMATKQMDTLSENHIRLGQEVADIIAIAVHQTRLQQAIEEHAIVVEENLSELKQIYQLSLTLSGLQTIAEVAQETTAIIKKATEADLVLFFVKQNDRLKLAAHLANNLPHFTKIVDIIPIGHCLCGLAAHSGKSMFSINPSEDARCSLEYCQKVGIRSHSAIPMVVNGKVLGVIALGSLTKRDFSLQKSFLETLVNEAALALQNALLLEELRAYEADLEKRIARRTEELLVANRELESFSYSVSHDLRAPLRAIDGFSRILEEEYGQELDPKAQRLVQTIRQNAQRMQQLIHDLLAFSRSGRQAIRPAKINMTDMATAIYFELTDEAQRARVAFELNPLPDITADPILMRQVWQNLLANALKFTQKRKIPRIEIGFFKRQEAIVYFVKDNGVGFDMKYSAKLFQIFQRLHASEDFEGTGVGLSIVQRIINRHGGRVWAEGEVNKGATFFFALPIR